MRNLHPYLYGLICVLLAGCGRNPAIGSGGVARREPAPSVNRVVAAVQGVAPGVSAKASGVFDVECRVKVMGASGEGLGWVAAGKGVFYKTADTGRTWKRLRIDLPAGAEITDLFFADDSTGWASAGLYSADSLHISGNRAWMLTTGDGGRTWETRYEGTSVDLRGTCSRDGREGWAVGARYVRRPTLQTEYFVLHTADGGQSWDDFSAGPNQLAADGEGKVQDAVSDCTLNGQARPLLLTEKGRLLTGDGAATGWRKFSDAPTEFLTRAIRDVPGGGLGVIGGSLTRRNVDGSWTEYVFGSFELKDAVFISESKILICGSILLRSGASPVPEKRGVILFSDDGGKTWSEVRGAASGGSPAALALIGEDHVWSVSTDGSLFQIQTPLAD